MRRDPRDARSRATRRSPQHERRPEVGGEARREREHLRGARRGNRERGERRRAVFGAAKVEHEPFESRRVAPHEVAIGIGVTRARDEVRVRREPDREPRDAGERGAPRLRIAPRRARRREQPERREEDHLVMIRQAEPGEQPERADALPSARHARRCDRHDRRREQRREREHLGRGRREPRHARERERRGDDRRRTRRRAPRDARLAQRRDARRAEDRRGERRAVRRRRSREPPRRAEPEEIERIAGRVRDATRREERRELAVVAADHVARGREHVDDASRGPTTRSGRARAVAPNPTAARTSAIAAPESRTIARRAGRRRAPSPRRAPSC